MTRTNDGHEPELGETTPISRPTSDKRYNILGLRCTKRDCLLILLTATIRFGDAIEFYLPGVITQKVACELGVSRVKEGFLGIAFYVTLAASYLVSAPLARWFGKKRTILASLYTSILFSVFCAVVPNYYTLLVSRALIGLCVGINAVTVGVLFSEEVSSREVYKVGTSLGSFCIAGGGGWVAVIGYLLLNTVGWRVFVLITSLPLFVPPIIMLHCCFSETSGNLENPIDSQSGGQSADETTEATNVDNYWWRVIQASFLCFINMLQGWGGILLLPALLRHINEKNMSPADKSDDEPCVNAVQGTQLLIIAMVTGGGNMLGRVAGYLVSGRGNFTLTQGVLAVVITASYAAILLNDSLVSIVVAMSVAKITYSMMMLEITLISFDAVFFGAKGLALASSIVWAMGAMGAVVGNSFAAFLPEKIAVWWTFAFSVVQVGVVCSFIGR